jgi:hypothetical protein
VRRWHVRTARADEADDLVGRARFVWISVDQGQMAETHDLTEGVASSQGSGSDVAGSCELETVTGRLYPHSVYPPDSLDHALEGLYARGVSCRMTYGRA